MRLINVFVGISKLCAVLRQCCGDTCLNFAVNAWNPAKTTKMKSGILQNPVILTPDFDKPSALKLKSKKEEGKEELHSRNLENEDLSHLLAPFASSSMLQGICCLRNGRYHPSSPSSVKRAQKEAPIACLEAAVPADALSVACLQNEIVLQV